VGCRQEDSFDGHAGSARANSKERGRRGSATCYISQRPSCSSRIGTDLHGINLKWQQNKLFLIFSVHCKDEDGTEFHATFFFSVFPLVEKLSVVGTEKVIDCNKQYGPYLKENSTIPGSIARKHG